MITTYAIENILLLFVIAINFLLASFVYKNNPASATNRLFALLSVLMSLWLSVLALAVAPNAEKETALFFSRLSIFFATAMNATFFMLAYIIPSVRFSFPLSRLPIFLAVTGFVMLTTLSPYAFTDLILETRTIVTGVGIVPFGLFSIGLTALSCYTFVRKIQNSSQVIERQQLLFVATGVALMLSLLFFFVFVPVALFNNYSFVPFAPLCALIFLGMTAYAIVRHRFLDIRFILIRAISFLLASILLSLLYAFGIFLVIHFVFVPLPGLYAYVFGIVFMAVAILWFGPVSNRIRKRANRYFFRGEYDKDQLLSVVTKIMTETIDLDNLADATLSTLKEEMRLASAGFLIVEKHKVVGVKGDNYSFTKQQQKILEGLFHRVPTLGSSSFFLFEDLEDFEMKDVFRDSGVSLAVTIVLNESEVAILLLGAKLSGETFNQRDIDFLGVFAPEAGIAIQNAKAYTEIKNFSKKLEQRVAERTKELKESQERELEKAASVVKLKDEFVYVAAHELRTPITAIRGFLELVSEAEGAYPKDVQEDLDNIKFASDHLNQLVNDLLEVARSESQVIKIQAEPFDVVELIHKILAELSSLLQKKNIQLSVGDYHRDFKIMADPEKLKEVLVNLISNAIKYNKDGGALEINILPFEEDVIIEIRDSGFGIPQDQQAKIFQKFFRASSTSTQGIIGTGLGLFITRMLIEKMGGSIFFSSLEGHGTTFSVALPKSK